MHRRQPLPRLWMMTDERQGDAIWGALSRLPRGSGIVFRHYGLPARERRRLFEQMRREARRRNHRLLLAGPPGLAAAWRADGSHGPGRGRPPQPRTASAHDLAQIRAAERSGAALVFLSPVFPTRSHPGARVLGPLRFGLLARQSRLPVIALGGMDARGWQRIRPLGAQGWAAIDAWSAAPAAKDQKRKAVPI